MTTINERVFTGSQSWNYEHTMTLCERKVRISIKIDSVPSQGFARVELFDGNQWNNIITRTQNELEFRPSYAKKGVQTWDFDTDALWLMEETKALLS